MNSFFKFTIAIVALLSLSACQETKNSKPHMMNGYIGGTNPNSVAFKAKDNALERENKVKMAEIKANSQIEIAKIESKKAVFVAKIDNDTKKDIATKTATTTLAVTKLDTQTKEKQSMMYFYISLGFLIALIIGIVLWFLHKKKSLELQMKLEENRLKHELEIKEKELQEQRIQKVLDLAISGQFPQKMQEDVILSLTQNPSKLIESK